MLEPVTITGMLMLGFGCIGFFTSWIWGKKLYAQNDYSYKTKLQKFLFFFMMLMTILASMVLFQTS